MTSIVFKVTLAEEGGFTAISEPLANNSVLITEGYCITTEKTIPLVKVKYLIQLQLLYPLL